MRTNIVLDEELLEEARRYSAATTKRGLVEEALRTFVAIKAEERKRAEYLARVLDLQHRTSGLRLREDSLTILREDRDRP